MRYLITAAILTIIVSISNPAFADFCDYQCWDYNGDSTGTYSSVFSSANGIDHDLHSPGTGSTLFGVSYLTYLGNVLYVPAIKTWLDLPFAVYEPIVYVRNEGGDPFTLEAWNSTSVVATTDIAANTNILYPAKVCTDEPIVRFQIISESAEPVIVQICYLEEPGCAY